MTRCRSIIVRACLQTRVCASVHTELSEHGCGCKHVCMCVCVCYAWRHTCSNRVVVDSDSCPVPFTAQSSQPPLCSVRLLMRINVLWRPLRVPPHSPPNSTANEETQPCQNTEVKRERHRWRQHERERTREEDRKITAADKQLVEKK